VVTVVDVAWETGNEESTRVEVHDSEGGLVATEWRTDATGSATLVGVPASSRLEARLVTSSGEVLASRRFMTGAYPSDLPQPVLTGAPGWDGLLVTSYVGATAAALVLDEAGTIRWYHPTAPGLLARARLRPDARGIRYLWESKAVEPWEGFVADVDWHGGDLQVRSGDVYPTHDFVTLADGTLGLIGSSRIPGTEDDDANLTDSTIVEVRPDGEIVVLWDALEDYYPDGPVGADDMASHWTHGNSLHLDSERDAWWIGFRNRNAFALVDRATGTTLARIGDEFGEYTFGEGARFQNQHAFQFVEGGHPPARQRRVGARRVTGAAARHRPRGAHGRACRPAHARSPVVGVRARRARPPRRRHDPRGVVERRRDRRLRARRHAAGEPVQRACQGLRVHRIPRRIPGGRSSCGRAAPATEPVPARRSPYPASAASAFARCRSRTPRRTSARTRMTVRPSQRTANPLATATKIASTQE
jgi:hypothetical protein